jgi:hypothetical protein
MPLLATVLGVTIGGADAYGGERFCWINDSTVLGVAFMLPFFTFLAGNVVMLVMTISTLQKASMLSGGRRKRRSVITLTEKRRLSLETAQSQLKPMVVLFFTLGLSWIFGAVINVNDPGSSLAFQYLFAILSALQGLSIFLFHCVFSKSVREAWRQKQADRARHAGSKLPYKATSSSPGDLSVSPVASGSFGTGTSTSKAGTLTPSSQVKRGSDAGVDTMALRASTGRMSDFYEPVVGLGGDDEASHRSSEGKFKNLDEFCHYLEVEGIDQVDEADPKKEAAPPVDPAYAHVSSEEDSEPEYEPVDDGVHPTEVDSTKNCLEPADLHESEV